MLVILRVLVLLVGCGAGCSRNVPLGGRSGSGANESGHVGTQV